MTSDRPVLAEEYEDNLDRHTKAQLLARVGRLLRYDTADTDETAFKQNSRECKSLYDTLEGRQ